MLILKELVGLGDSKRSKCFLGKFVADLLSLSSLLVLPEVHGFKGSGTTDEFMRELGLVVFGVFVLVDVVASCASVIYVFLVFELGSRYWGNRPKSKKPILRFRRMIDV